MRIPDHLEFKRCKTNGRMLVAAKPIKKNVPVLRLKGRIVDYKDASPEAVQLGKNTFLDSKHYYVEDYINHSCNPNTKIDFKTFQFVALRDIRKGEEITYNYLTTEYDMSRDGTDFRCHCGSRKCVKHVRGFKFLTDDHKIRLKRMLSPFLKSKLNL